MSKISDKKIEKIKSDILAILYEKNLKPFYTFQIAEEVARDDEFTLKLIRVMEKNGLVKQANKGNRRKWIMSDNAYKAYSEIL